MADRIDCALASTKIVVFAALVCCGSCLAQVDTEDFSAEAIERNWREGRYEEVSRLARTGLVQGSGGEERFALYRRWHGAAIELRQWAEAESAARGWLAEAIDSEDETERVEAELAVASALTGKGNRRAAGQLLEGALDRSRADPGFDLENGLEVRLLLALAGNEIPLGEFSLGEQRLVQAADQLGSMSDRELELRLLTLEGMLAQFRGEPFAALQLRREALDLAQQLPDPSVLARRQADLGLTLIELHDYAGAIELLEPLRTASDSEARSLAFFGLGISYFELNRLTEARPAFELLEAEARDEGNLSGEGLAVGELGLVYQKLGELDLAIEAFDRAILLCRKSGDRANELVWLSNKGVLYRDLDRFEDAKALFAKALAIAEEIGGRRSRASELKHLGESEVGLGNDRAAERLFEDALEAARETGDTKTIWQTERERARLFERTGRSSEALQSYEAALETIETMRSTLRLESFKTDFFEDKVAVFEETVDLLLKPGVESGRERAFTTSERARSRAFLDTLVESRAEVHTTLPGPLREEEQRLHHRIAELQTQLRRGERGAQGEDELARAEQSLEVLELEVRAARPRLSELRRLAPTTIRELQAHLGKGEGVVAYWLGDGSSHAFVIESEGFEHVTLPARSAIESAMQARFVDLLDKETTPNFSDLSELLIEPLWQELAHLSSLLVVPSGMLFYFPFEALPVPDLPLPTVGDPAAGLRPELLGERFTVSYWPSASTIVELRSRPTVSPQTRLLAFADPHYGSSEGGDGGATLDLSQKRSGALLSLGGLGALPHTRDEVGEIARLFGRQADVFLGERAREGALYELDLDRFSVVHFATHGLIDPTSASRSGLVLTSPASGKADGNDGILQPREILRLQLAAEMVTLSACQSALGELVTGEGMVSLARSFFYAGTDTVVASLWNVNDRASAELMGSFYRGLADGLSKGEALAAARQELRSRPEYSHPYYWAAWILLGEGRGQVTFPASDDNNRIALIVLALLLLAPASFVLSRWHRR